MNRTQKGAWFTLGIAVLLLAFNVNLFIEMFDAGRTAGGLHRFWALLIFGFMGISAVFLHKKQSPAEVDFDERDNLIRKRAVLACFVSVWILLIASSIIPVFIVGDWGSIPVCVLPIINLGVFLIVMLVYSVAVLVQYGREGKDGKE